MKTLGLIGGMSWESTIPYYRIINEEVRDRLGGLHSARIILYSAEFSEIEKLQSDGEWEKAGDILGEAARMLEDAGADYLVICTNTMHKVADQIASYIKIPILHIADATADVLEQRHVSRVGLLGTKYTMLHDFYRKRLSDRGIETVIPDQSDAEMINAIIFNELCIGDIRGESRRKCLEIIDKLRERGAEGVILGCTELGLLISRDDIDMPVFDTTVIHAEKAAELALEGYSGQKVR